MPESITSSNRKVSDSTDYPKAPRSLADTKLGVNFLISLLLKLIYINGLESVPEMQGKLKLPNNSVASLVQDCVSRKLLESLGSETAGSSQDLRYALSSLGRDWALDAFKQSNYIGPAPVRIPDYIARVQKQRITEEYVDFRTLARCFSDLILPDSLISEIGAAITSSSSMLFYGPAGNGKTSIAKRIMRAFQQTIYVPYSLEIDGQVINVFDSSVHKVARDGDPRADKVQDRRAALRPLDERWVRCHRPIAVTGGELTPEMLELSFSPYSKVYEAPLQLKANGGILIIDDFGRQIARPTEILNRWVIPLETKVDYLALQTGRKIAVPFDQLVILSTNVDPEELLDDAMNRRIDYKIKLDHPSAEEYTAIFEGVCREFEVECPKDLVAFLLDEIYIKKKVNLARFHPKWIVEHVVDRARFDHNPIVLDRASAVSAMENLDVRVKAQMTDANPR